MYIRKTFKKLFFWNLLKFTFIKHYHCTRHAGNTHCVADYYGPGNGYGYRYAYGYFNSVLRGVNYYTGGPRDRNAFDAYTNFVACRNTINRIMAELPYTPRCTWKLFLHFHPKSKIFKSKKKTPDYTLQNKTIS